MEVFLLLVAGAVGLRWLTGLFSGGGTYYEEYEEGASPEQHMLHALFFNDEQMRHAYPELYDGYTPGVAFTSDSWDGSDDGW